MSASIGQNGRGGRSATRRAARTASISALPSAVRRRISANGEISRTTALVATNETPQNTTASRAPARGDIGRALEPRDQARRQGGALGKRGDEHVLVDRVRAVAVRAQPVERRQ